MKIGSFSIDQQAMSKYQKVEKKMLTIEVQNNVPQDALDISDEAIVKSEELEEEDFLSEKDKRKIQLLEAFITWMTGKKFKFNKTYLTGKKPPDSKPIQGPNKRHINMDNRQSGGVGIRIQSKHEIHEKEQMSFSSNGKIQTEDGRSIEFELNLHMSRETYEYNEVNLQMGNFHDPLVMNFDGNTTEFSDKKLRIDINLDGQLDEINFLKDGSGFLALDRNNNGKIDDGSELFGPKTNAGFEELRAFDQDGNHWIDENDSVFESLKIWTLNEAGEASLIGLADADVGAIYLGDVASQYTLKHGDEDMAKIARSSIYLSENGRPNTIHEVDLKL